MRADRERDEDDAERQVDAERDAERDTEQAGVRDRRAEVGHAPPDDEAAERRGDDAERDAGNERAHEKRLEQVRLCTAVSAASQPLAARAAAVRPRDRARGRGRGGRWRRRAPPAGPNRRTYSGCCATVSGTPEQQTCRFRQTTRSLCAMTTCRSWLTSSTPRPRVGADAADQAIELGLADDNRRRAPARRAPEVRGLRISARARIDALQLAAREAAPVADRRHAPAPTSSSTAAMRVGRGRLRQRQEARDRHRDGRIAVEALRRIADGEARCAARPHRCLAARGRAGRARASSCRRRSGRSASRSRPARCRDRHDPGSAGCRGRARGRAQR